MAAAVPVAMMIGSAISSHKTAKGLQKQATTLSPQETAAQTGAMGTAGTLGGVGRSLYGQGTSTLQQPTSYYQTLLGKGGRGAMESAVAPQAESISDLYKGVSRGLEGSNVRGGVKDLALAEAEREKTGRISRLTAGVQPAAASALTDIGRFQTGTGIGATSEAGGLYSNLLGQGRSNRALGLQAGLAANEQSSSAGQNIGQLLFTLLSSSGGKSGGSRSIGYRGLPVGAG